MMLDSYRDDLHFCRCICSARYRQATPAFVAGYSERVAMLNVYFLAGLWLLFMVKILCTPITCLVPSFQLHVILYTFAWLVTSGLEGSNGHTQIYTQ
jgi:hypothetical protein